MEVGKIYGDFANGVFDTLITAPIALGDFIARGTGIRDWQLGTGEYYMRQAKHEVDIMLSVFSNKGGSGEIALDTLLKEVNEKPAYFLGGFVGGYGAGAGLTHNSLKAANVLSITAAKADNIIHRAIEENPELYELFSEMGLIETLSDGNIGAKILENKDDIIKILDEQEKNVEKEQQNESDVGNNEINTEQPIDRQETSDNSNNPYGLIDIAKHNVSLINQNINQSYDDIMGFLFS